MAALKSDESDKLLSPGLPGCCAGVHTVLIKTFFLPKNNGIGYRKIPVISSGLVQLREDLVSFG